LEEWKARFIAKIVTAEQAVSHVRNGDRIYLGSLCAEPGVIIDALARSDVEDVEIVQFVGGPRCTALAAQSQGRFRVKTFFVGGRASDTKRPSEADYVPLYHSQIPTFLRNRRIPVDVAIVQVSEPDRFNRFSLGVAVDIALSAVGSARTVIAQVNPKMPRTHGDTCITGDRIHYLVDGEEDLHELPEETLGDTERAICRFCCELIEDGSVMQFGFASISRGLHDYIRHHKRLGLHTEILTDPAVDLIESGVITNETKSMYRGKSLATCCMGTRRVYDFVHDNSVIELYPSDVVLNPAFIASNDRMVAVNLALQVDLRGQIRQGIATWTAFEGSGGDQDFMRGASLSRRGRSIVCLRSSSLRSGRSTIVPSFGPGAAVMMNRGDVQYIVTEYGIAYLGGKSVRERAMALIEIAHPDHREALMNNARSLGYIYSNQYYVRSCSPEFENRVRTDTVLKDGLKTRIRLLKPSDESMMRDLFYHLSESSVYFRYFGPRRSLPHENLQRYCNLSEAEGLSIVATIGPKENRRIIGEGRYIFESGSEFPETAFMVEENYQDRGLGTYLLNYLIGLAKERGVKGFKAEVIHSNIPMLQVLDKVSYVLHKQLSEGIITVSFRFDEPKEEPHIQR